MNVATLRGRPASSMPRRRAATGAELSDVGASSKSAAEGRRSLDRSMTIVSSRPGGNGSDGMPLPLPAMPAMPRRDVAGDDSSIGITRRHSEHRGPGMAALGAETAQSKEEERAPVQIDTAEPSRAERRGRSNQSTSQSVNQSMDGRMDGRLYLAAVTAQVESKYVRHVCARSTRCVCVCVCLYVRV